MINLNIYSTGASLRYKDSEGQTIMHFVARDWNLDLAIFLRFHRADLDTPDNFGRTPLFVAVAMNYKAMVEWLLDHKGKHYVDHVLC